MEPDFKRDISNWIGNEVYELSWRKNLPINPGVGIVSFIMGLVDYGAYVKADKEKVAISHFYDVNETMYSFREELTYDEVLSGWKRYPRGSLNTLYDSLFMLYDRMGANFKDLESSNSWSEIRDSKPKLIRKHMETHLKDYFLKYHENMLIPIWDKTPKMTKPRLFDKIWEDFPTDLLYKACTPDRHPKGSPNPEYIMDIDNSEYDEHYYPSESSMLSYLWGIYINELRKDKGYPLAHDDDLKTIITYGGDAIESGSLIWKLR